MANLLGTYGVQRESRIALLLLDTVDFPVAFWGAIKAGVVPVCLNTLLTTEQYAYILGDSRARSAFVSAPLLPVVQPILGQLPFLKHIFVAGGEPPPFALSLRGELQFQAAEFQAADTCCDETAFWLYSSGSTGMPKGVRHVHSSPMETARLSGQGCLGIREDDLVFSAAKLFFAYGLGNSMSFPMSVGATSRAAARSADAGVGVPHAQAASADRVLRRADAVRGDAGLSAGHAREQLAAPAPVRFRRRGAAGRDRQGLHAPSSASTFWMASAPPRCCTSTSATVRAAVRYGTSGKPVPGYDIRLVDEQGNDVPDGEVGEMLVRGSERRARATGTSARRAAPPSRAAGRARATSTRATRTATTPTRAAPTTCSRCRASGCRRSRWRAR